MEKVKLVKLEMVDPTFEGGSTHIARATMSNPTSMDFNYEAELYLSDRAATSGMVPFFLAAGATITVDFTLTMPTIEGEYEVFLDIFSGGGLIVAAKATENVIIEVTPDIVIGPIEWE